MLDRDPPDAAPEETSQSRVRATYVDGVPIYQK
ncbi:hypothetical protein [Xanthobacter dioxanivorans]